ncbi:ABC transporter permease [bacterium]|nr:ABC transporter permease [bacterium]
MVGLFQQLGERVLESLTRLGESAGLMGRTALELPRVWSVRRELVEQMMRIGIASLPLVAVTSLFTGMVIAVQTSYQVEQYVPDLFISAAIGKSVIIELSPVLTALVLSGRVGASIAAELGTMRVTEQIDAMETMALDPVRFLVLPRVIAGMIMMPVIVVYSSAIAIGGAYMICMIYLEMSRQIFMQGISQFVLPWDIYSGVIKSLVFGLTVATVGCCYGYYAPQGAAGVGQTTTRSVVTNCLLVLIFDYILALILFPTQ